MKRLIHIFIILTICHNSGYAQKRDETRFRLTESNYTSDTLRMDGYTYVCDTLSGTLINLYNIENKIDVERWCYKDGTPYNPRPFEEPELYTLSDAGWQLLESIVDEAFTQSQVELIGGHDKLSTLRIDIDISSTDGTITDVYFTYLTMQKYVEIPIYVFRDIELGLKKKIRFTLTDEGCKMKVCTYFWRQRPKGRIEIEPTIENPSDGGGGGFTGNPIGNK